jgi:hypothetical protein
MLCIYRNISRVKHRPLLALVVALEEHVTYGAVRYLLEFLYVFALVLAFFLLCSSLIFLVLIQAVF